MGFERGVGPGRAADAGGDAAVGTPGKRSRSEALAGGGTARPVPVGALISETPDVSADTDADVGTAVRESDADDPFAVHLIGERDHDELTGGGPVNVEMKQAPGGAASTTTPATATTTAAGDIGEPITETDGHDSIGGGIAFTGAYSRGGTVDAGDFGTTETTYPALTNVKITKGTGTFTVAADFALAVTWQVLTGDGPSSQKHISGDTDALLTKDNYPTAASDLTPDMSDLKGKPPRTKFWARDLTEIHEQFHAKERVKFGKEGVTEATKWLAAQTATDEAGVRTHLADARTKIIAYVRSKMVNPGKEERAYTDGAPAYKARAEAIEKKGKAGGYP